MTIIAAWTFLKSTLQPALRVLAESFLKFKTALAIGRLTERGAPYLYEQNASGDLRLLSLGESSGVDWPKDLMKASVFTPPAASPGGAARSLPKPPATRRGPALPAPPAQDPPTEGESRPEGPP